MQSAFMWLALSAKFFVLLRAWRFLRYRKLMRLEQTFDVPTHLAFLERVPQWFDEMPLGALD